MQKSDTSLIPPSRKRKINFGNVPDDYFLSFCSSTGEYSLVNCIPAFKTVRDLPPIPPSIKEVNIFCLSENTTNQPPRKRIHLNNSFYDIRSEPDGEVISILEEDDKTHQTQMSIQRINNNDNINIFNEKRKPTINFASDDLNTTSVSQQQIVQDEEIDELEEKSEMENVSEEKVYRGNRVPLYIKLNLRCFPPQEVRLYIAAKNPVPRAFLLCFYYGLGARTKPKYFEIINKYKFHIYVNFFMLSTKSKLTKSFMSREKTLRHKWFDCETSRYKGGRMLRVRPKKILKRQINEMWSEMMQTVKCYHKHDIPSIKELDDSYFFDNITRKKVEKRDNQIREFSRDEDCDILSYDSEGEDDIDYSRDALLYQNVPNQQQLKFINSPSAFNQFRIPPKNGFNGF